MYEVHVSVTVVGLQSFLHCEQSLQKLLSQLRPYTQSEHPLFEGVSGVGAFGAGAGAVADVVLGVAAFDTDTGS